MPADEITIEGSLEAVICFDSCADRVTVNRFVANIRTARPRLLISSSSSSVRFA